MMKWDYVVIVLCLSAAIVLCLKEANRVNKNRLWLRIICTMLAFASLACIAIKPSVKKEIKVEHTEAVLITDGYTKDSLERLKGYKEGLLPTYTINNIGLVDSSIKLVHVFGYGLSDAEIELLKGKHLVFHASPIKGGLVAAHWNQQLKSGKKLVLQGRYINNYPEPVKIILQGFDTNLDSISVAKGDTSVFELQTVPKHIGKAVYSLIVSTKAGIQQHEPVPIEIELTSKLKVLVLSASPDFENKFLSRWLSENGYAVVTRTRISKDKFDKSFLNTGNIQFNKLNNTFLDQFDMVISDATELAALDKAEQSLIHSQVTEKGMGLIVKADSIISHGAFYANPFAQYTVQGRKAPVSLFIRDQSRSIGSIIDDQYTCIKNRPGEQSLVTDSLGNIFVSRYIEGTGNIVFSTIHSSYRWKLEGNNDNYTGYWLGLLQKIVRKKVQGKHISYQALSSPGDKIDLGIEADEDSLTIKIDNNNFPASQNPIRSYLWQTSYWATTSGWQPAILLNGNQYNWYKYAEQDWKNISDKEKIKRTREHIYYKNNTPGKEMPLLKIIRTAIPVFYFLLIFITCCAFLWIERKLSPS